MYINPTKKCFTCKKQIVNPYCKRCYPCAMKFKTRRPEDRFIEKVNKTESCWLWTGAKSGFPKYRYGNFFDGVRNVRAIRFSFEMHKRKIKEGFEILHNCPGGDNRLCVNPDHLVEGRHAENMADASRKGQMESGENRKNSKLTKNQVREIRSMYVPFRMSYPKLAKKFNVSKASIQAIIERRVWRHIS